MRSKGRTFCCCLTREAERIIYGVSSPWIGVLLEMPTVAQLFNIPPLGTHNDHCRIRCPQSWSVSTQYILWHLICLAPVLTLCSQIYCKWCHLVRISDSYVFISYNAEHYTRVGSILTSDTEGEEFNSRPEYWLSCLKFFVFFFSGPSGVGLYHINPLKPELNPICYLLALLAHHFLHISRIRFKSLTLRWLMSYIYGAPILEVSRSHTTTQHSR